MRLMLVMIAMILKGTHLKPSDTGVVSRAHAAIQLDDSDESDASDEGPEGSQKPSDKGVVSRAHAGTELDDSDESDDNNDIEDNEIDSVAAGIEAQRGDSSDSEIGNVEVGI